MSFIWENYSSDNKFILSNIIDGDETIENTNSSTIAVNPMLRFSEIFESNNDSFEKSIYNEINNIVIHYLAQLDLIYGKMRYDIQYSVVSNEIKSGRFGEEVKSIFEGLNTKERMVILYYIDKYQNSNNRKNYFNKAFFDLFESNNTLKSPEIYYNKENNKKYCFCAVNATLKNENKFRIIQLLFADITFEYVPIWGEHCFGIIDGNNSSTPAIGDIQVIDY